MLSLKELTDHTNLKVIIVCLSSFFSVQKMLKPDPGVIFSKLSNGVEVSKLDVYRLNKARWLNDNLINFYFSLIGERGKESGFPSVYAFSSYFYSSLNKNGAGSVLKWTSKIPDKQTIFDFDILFVPLHLEAHWALCAVDNRKRIVKYYDSMETTDPDSKMKVLESIESYLIAEADHKLKPKIAPGTYKLEIVDDIPVQSNVSDCGMFVLRYAECISRDVDISFNQTHIEVLRKLMIKEIFEKKIKIFNGNEPPLGQ